MAGASYETERDKAIKHFLDLQIGTFLEGPINKTRHTIILLPGIMGSQLKSLREPFSSGSTPDLKNPLTVWVDEGVLYDDDALRLYIDPASQRDGFYGRNPAQDFIVYASGKVYWKIPKGSLGYIGYYDNAENFFYRKSWNYLAFGFDWRRSPAESAAWLKYVVGELIKKGFRPEKIHLVGHSMGGLVAKLFLNEIDGAAANWVGKVITIGTPYYGGSPFDSPLLGAFYYGHRLLVTELKYRPDSVATVIGSMLGAYCLLYLDIATFAADGQTLGLIEYPVMTHNTPGQAADPLDQALLTRYPLLIPLSARRKFLAEARAIKQAILKRLTPNALPHLWNLRSGVNRKTALSLWWKDLDGSKFVPPKNRQEYDDAMADPVVRTRTTGADIGANAPCGDGTVPFWSAALAQMLRDQPAHVVNLKKDDNGEHAELLQNEETLRAIETIVESPALGV